MKRKKSRLAGLVFTCVLTLTTATPAELWLPSVFSDHMVLQQQQPVPVWGKATAGATVTVEFSEQKKITVADENGKWRVDLDPLKASSEPRTLTVVSQVSGFKFQVSDVLVGEVWLCVGQSNMEWGIKKTTDWEAVVNAADLPQLRLFSGSRASLSTPSETLPEGSAWAVCTPQALREGGSWPDAGFSATAFYFGQKLQCDLDVPVGLIQAALTGQLIWQLTPPGKHLNIPDYEKLARQDERLGAYLETVPGEVYNGMIHGLTPFALRGVIWYQGESDHTDGLFYTEKMKALIVGYRAVFEKPSLAFYYVQIAPFQYTDEESHILPEFWEAQAKVLKLPNTGMAIIHDAAVLNNIHPPNKAIPGTRLARLAEAKTYGMDVVCNGPVFNRLEKTMGRLKVVFGNAKGLTTSDGKAPDYFELYSRTCGWVPAQAAISGDGVVLTARGVSDAIGMRYAWHKTAMPNLRNGAGLPASSFRAGTYPERPPSVR